MLTEFQKFIAKGNVMDMAVGIIIGAAFTAIVKSMVDDLLNPIIGTGSQRLRVRHLSGDRDVATSQGLRSQSGRVPALS